METNPSSRFTGYKRKMMQTPNPAAPSPSRQAAWTPSVGSKFTLNTSAMAENSNPNTPFHSGTSSTPWTPITAIKSNNSFSTSFLSSSSNSFMNTSTPATPSFSPFNKTFSAFPPRPSTIKKSARPPHNLTNSTTTTIPTNSNINTSTITSNTIAKPSNSSTSTSTSKRLLAETDRHTLSSLAPLPTAVLESLAGLSSSNSNSNSKLNSNSNSAKVSSAIDSYHGLAWMVISSSVFVWQTIGSRSRYAACQRLALPSDLSHRSTSASHIAVIPDPNPHGSGSERISSHGLVAVSPTGSMTYWPTVAHLDSATVVRSQIRLDPGEDGEIDRVISLRSSFLESLSSEGGVTGDHSDELEDFDDDKFDLARVVVAITSLGKCILVRLNEEGNQLQHIWVSTSRSSSFISGITSFLGFASSVSGLTASVSGPTSTWEAVIEADGRALVPRAVAFEPSSSHLYTLSESRLTCWYLSNSSSFQWSSPLSELIATTLQSIDEPEDQVDLSVWLIDFAITSSPSSSSTALTCLVASTPSQCDDSSIPLLQYSLIRIELPTDTSKAPSLDSIIPLLTLSYSPDFEPRAMEPLIRSLSLVIPNRGPSAYVVSPSFVILTAIPEDGRALDMIPFVGQAETILGRSSHGDSLLLLTARHGIVGLRQPSLLAAQPGSSSALISHLPAEPESTTSLPLPSPARYTNTINTSSRTGEQQEKTSQSFAEDVGGEPAGLLSTTTKLPLLEQFLTFQKLRLDSQSETINLSSLGYSSSEILDASTYILDGKPAADPRWATSSAKLSTSTSALISSQLASKAARHRLFVGFLSATSLLTPDLRLSLLNHGEKLSAASALREFHNSIEKERAASQLTKSAILEAISKVLDKKGLLASSWSSSALSPSDHFYSKVSIVDCLVGQLFETQSSLLSRDLGELTTLDLIYEVNGALYSILGAATSYRTESFSLYFPQEIEDLPHSPVELCTTPWTAASLTLSSLMEQIKTSVTVIEGQVAVSTTSSDILELLYSQLAQLCDLVLSIYTTEIERLEASRSERRVIDSFRASFASSRSRLMSIFLKSGRNDVAQSLAERYLDFETLIKLGSPEQIDDYMKKYEGEGFPRYLYQSYFTQGKRAELLSLPEEYDGLGLAEFLGPHPELSWHNSIRHKRFGSASSELTKAAQSEIDSYHSKQTLLSLAKLSLIAAEPDLSTEDYSSKLAAIEQELFLVKVQSKIRCLGSQETVLDASNMIDTLFRVEIKSEGVKDEEVAELALDIYEKSVSTRSSEENTELLSRTWIHIFDQSPWLDWVSTHANPSTAFDDQTLASKLKSTLLYRIGLHHPIGGAGLTRSIVDSIHSARSPQTEHSTTLQALLGTALNLLLEDFKEG